MRWSTLSTSAIVIAAAPADAFPNSRWNIFVKVAPRDSWTTHMTLIPTQDP